MLSYLMGNASKELIVNRFVNIFRVDCNVNFIVYSITFIFYLTELFNINC